MFNFLQPIYLFALAGIAIPVLIHLWNIRKGKTLKVGSILLLSESSKQQSKSFRLHDLLLLFLRCLVIILFALLLSEPVWIHPIKTGDQKGWILIEKESLSEAYKNHKLSIDSLLAIGYELYQASAGYPKMSLTDTASLIEQSGDKTLPSYWAILSALDQQLPVNFPIVFVTTDYLNRFSGPRPGIAINVKWLLYSSIDSTSRWLADAWLTNEDSIRILFAESNGFATTFNPESVPVNELTRGEFDITIHEGKMFVSTFKENVDQDQHDVEVDTSSINITIFSQPGITGGEYLLAGFEAIRDYTDRKINLHFTSDKATIPNNQDWIFWLSDEAPDSSSNPKNLVKYAQGEQINYYSWLQIPGIADNFSNQVDINKRISPNNANPQIRENIWEDGFSNPILSRTKNGKQNVYELHTRLNPNWTELPWSSQLPRVLLKMVLNDSAHQYDGKVKSKIDHSQVQPYKKAGVNFAVSDDQRKTDLKRWIWLVLIIVFVIERFLSFKRKGHGAYG